MERNILVTIELTNEQTDDIVIAELLSSLTKLMEEEEENEEYIVAFEKVLDWYGG